MSELPERDPRHNLDTWKNRADHLLHEAELEREATQRLETQAAPDVQEVADRVLAPLRPKLRAVPRALASRVDAALAERGETAGKVKVDVLAHRVLGLGAQPVGRLAKALRVSLPVAARAVRVLVERGFATVTEGPAHESPKPEDPPVVALTPEGRAARPTLSRDPEYERKRQDEARRILAQDAASGDLELSLAVLLAAAVSWKPKGGWGRGGPRADRPDGFSSLGGLLAAAFSDLALGAGAIPLEVAQNRARTRSQGNEVFVQASHTGSAHARNAAAVERRADAQRLIGRSGADAAAVTLLFERHVLGRYATRDDLIDELRAREAKRRRVVGLWVNAEDPLDTRDGTVHHALPPRPAERVTTNEAELETARLELDAWRLAVGAALWGKHPKQAQHNRRHDRDLLRPVQEAEEALCAAIGLPAESKKRGRAVRTRPEATDA